MEETVFDAMNEFAGLAEVSAFTPQEVALFHVLLHAWNAGRRPEVIKQWARTTFDRTGLDKHSLPKTRNKLVQKGVIFFYKSGNRSVPEYSFNALFEKATPFCLLPHNGSKQRSKSGVNTVVNSEVKADSYQEEEKKKNKSKETATPPCARTCESQALKMFQNIDVDWLKSIARSFHSHFEMERWIMANGKDLIPVWQNRLRTWIEEKARREKPAGKTTGKQKLFKPV